MSAVSTTPELLAAYTLNKYRDDAPERKKQLLQLGRQFLAEGRLVESWRTILLARV